MAKKPSKRIAEPSLVVTTLTRVDRATRGRIKVTRLQRGILRREQRTFDSGSFKAFAKEMCAPPVRQSLEKLRDLWRDQLEEWGLPSDRQSSWVKLPGGDWEAYDKKIHGPFRPPYSFCLWTKRLEALTEPLSEKRLLGEALWDLDQLLRRKGIDEHLWHIAQLVSSMGTLRIAGATNAMAAAGMAARNGRLLGPEARRAKAALRHEVIRDLAAKLWAVAPKYKGDASNTAATIAYDVNSELAKRNLLPAGKDGMSVKTVADHLRTIIGDKHIRTG